MLSGTTGAGNGRAPIRRRRRARWGAIEAHGEDEAGLLIEKQKGLRHDASDHADLPGDDDLGADGRGIAAELALPVTVSEDHGLRGSGVVIRQRKPVAQSRMDSQGVECSFGDVQTLDLLRSRLPGDGHAAAGPHAELLKGAVFLAKGEVIRG